MSDYDAQVNKLRSELRRGVLVIAVLSQLDEPQYGYGLVQRLNERGLEIEEGTLYPLLRRLEKDDLLHSEWNTEDSRPRKYYSISPLGREVYTTLIQDWHETVTQMKGLIDG